MICDAKNIVRFSMTLACIAVGLTMWMVPKFASKINETRAQLSLDMLEFQELEQNIWYPLLVFLRKNIFSV